MLCEYKRDDSIYALKYEKEYIFSYYHHKIVTLLNKKILEEFQLRHKNIIDVIQEIKDIEEDEVKLLLKAYQSLVFDFGGASIDLITNMTDSEYKLYITNLFNKYIWEPYTIENDDSVNQFMQKVLLSTEIDPKYMYFFGNNENLGYKLHHKPDKYHNPVNILFNHNLNEPMDIENIKNAPNALSNIRITDDKSRLLSSYTFDDLLPSDSKTRVKIINAIDINQFIYKLTESSIKNKNLIKKIYFPQLDSNNINYVEELNVDIQQSVIDNIDLDRQSVDYIKNASTIIEELTYIPIPSDDEDEDEDENNALYTNLKETIPQYEKIKVLEAIIHVNYNTIFPEFLDINKIFGMFRLTEDVPFCKLMIEGKKNSPKFRVHRNLTKKNSNIFIDKLTLTKWMNPTGKSLSYKCYMYTDNKTNERKYATLNIYRDGKLEIKVYWKENNDTNINHIKDVVLKIRDNIIREINKLQYHVPGTDRLRLRIGLPDPSFMDNPNSNTKIAFLNTFTKMNYESPSSKRGIHNMKKFFSLFNTHIYIIKGNDPSSIEFRYKRVNNYQQLDGISTFIAENMLMESNITNLELQNKIKRKFGITLQETQDVINSYNIKVDQGKCKKQTKRGVKLQLRSLKNRIFQKLSELDVKQKITLDVIKNTISAHFGKSPLSHNDIENIYEEYISRVRHCGSRKIPPIETDSIIKHPGVNIKITISSSSYKIFIRGVTTKQLCEIHNFLKQIFYLYHYIPVLNKSDRFNKFLIPIRDVKENKSILKVIQESSNDRIVMSTKRANDKGIKPSVEKRKIYTGKSPLMLIKAAPGYNEEDYKGYSTKCQKNRQPHVMAPDTKDELLNQVQEQIKTATGEDLVNYTGFEKTLKKGVNFKGGFYFCPQTWHYNDNRFITSTELENIKNMKPKPDFYENKINKKIDWSGRNLGFLPIVTESCLPCCYKRSQAKVVNRTAECTGKGNKVADNRSSKWYILQSKNRDMENDRYAFLPEQLTILFNGNKNCEVKNIIEEDFSCYIRKSQKTNGNSLLVCLTEITELKSWTSLLKKIITLIKADDYIIFDVLKNGMMRTVFEQLDSSGVYINNNENKGEEGDGDEEEERKTYRKISAKKFITYIIDNKQEINEDFLWDLLVHRGIVTKTGINLFIFEAFYKKSEMIKLNLKCPIGYNVNTLYNSTKPSVVLLKIGNKYQTILKMDVKHSENKIFKPKNKFIAQFIKDIKQCKSIDNPKMVESFTNYINMTKNEAGLSKDESIIDEVYGFDYQPVPLLTLKSKLKVFNEYSIEYNNPDFMAIINNDQSRESTYYTIEKQVRDNYSRVNYITFKNGLSLPIKSSGINSKLPLVLSYEPLSYTDTIKHLTIIEKFAMLPEYRPYAILINPGEDLDDPDDDTIVGILLLSGMFVLVQTQLVNDLPEYVDVPTPYIDQDQSDSDSNFFRVSTASLSLSKKSDRWMTYNPQDVDDILSKSTRGSDSRKLFTVRINFETETYERLRFEVSKYLQLVQVEKKMVLDIINSTDKLTKKRKALFKILSKVIINLITDIPAESLEEMVGPLNISYNDMTKEKIEETINKYSLKYVKPIVRYECMNPELDEYNTRNVHCSNNRLYINFINLVDGKINFVNYINRLIEEFVRNPIKRQDILDDQIDNYVGVIDIYNKDEYYVDTSIEPTSNKNKFLGSRIKKMYHYGINYYDKYLKNYAIANPIGYVGTEYEEVTGVHKSSVCKGTYKKLTTYWFQKLKSMAHEMQYLHIQGDNDCIYKKIIEALNAREASKPITSTKLKHNIFDSFSENWEQALSYYKLYFPKWYNKANSINHFRHLYTNATNGLTRLDIAAISRLENVKFMILSNPGGKNKNGLPCLETTQTLNTDSYIILYQTGEHNYSIIHKTTSPPLTIFKQSDIIPCLVKLWSEGCSKDNSNVIDPLNELYKDTPQTIKMSVVNPSGKHITTVNKLVNNTCDGVLNRDEVINKQGFHPIDEDEDEDEGDGDWEGEEETKGTPPPRKKKKTKKIRVTLPTSVAHKSPIAPKKKKVFEVKSSKSHKKEKSSDVAVVAPKKKKVFEVKSSKSHKKEKSSDIAVVAPKKKKVFKVKSSKSHKKEKSSDVAKSPKKNTLKSKKKVFRIKK
jgi:hypothetical protein